MSARTERLGILAWQIWDKARIEVFQLLARLEDGDFGETAATHLAEQVTQLIDLHNAAAGLIRSVIEFPSLSLLLKGIGNKLYDLELASHLYADGDMAKYLKHRPLPPMPDIVHDAKTTLTWLLQIDFHRLLCELRDAREEDAAPPSEEAQAANREAMGQVVSPKMLERYRFARPMREKDEPISFARITEQWNKQNGDDIEPDTFEKGYRRTSDKLMSVR